MWFFDLALAQPGVPGSLLLEFSLLGEAISHQFELLDHRDLAYFKDRALSRHEIFNSFLKKWKVLDEVFRAHDLDDHQVCFEAVAAIACYQLDNGNYSLLDPYP